MKLLNRLKLSKREHFNNAEISKCFQRCFSNSDGDKILNYLTQITLERAMPSQATNDEIRHLEGQRYIVKFILNHCLTNQ